MRSPSALLASEMVTALRELSYESRLEALALATAETLLDPNHGGDAPSLMEAYTGRLTSTVREGLEKRAAAVSPRRPSLLAPMVDHLRFWVASDPTGKLRIVIKDQGDLGTLLLLSWLVEGMPTKYDSGYFATTKGALEPLNRDVLEPTGFPQLRYSKLGLL